MSRNTHDALCLECKKPIRVLSGAPQLCRDCLERELAKSQERNGHKKHDKPD